METSPLANELLQPGNNVQLEFYDEHGRKIIYRTSIWSFEKEQLKLLLPKNDNLFKNIKPGTRINVICRNDREHHDYVFRAEFIKVQPEHPLLIISKPPEIQFSVGRRFFRCEVRLPFSCFTKKEKVIGEVINLSANGLYVIVRPELNLELGSTLTCQIILPTSPEPILFVGKVARVIKEEDSQGIGINFQHITKNLQDQVTKYLFQRQRALINLGQIRIAKSE